MPKDFSDLCRRGISGSRIVVCKHYIYILEKAITKDILKDTLYTGRQPALELLYSRYGAMIFSYVLQFIPDKGEAEKLLVTIFSRLGSRLEQAFDSNLSVYCWLQVEARKILLEHIRQERVEGDDRRQGGKQTGNGGMGARADYYSLLNDASPEHQWVFRETFFLGRQREELARETGKDPAYIGRLLRESLLIIRNKLG